MTNLNRPYRRIAFGSAILYAFLWAVFPSVSRAQIHVCNDVHHEELVHVWIHPNVLGFEACPNTHTYYCPDNALDAKRPASMERLVRSYYSDYESITPSDPLDPPVSLLTATADRSDCTLHKYFPARGGGYTIYATDPNPGFEPLPPLGTTPIMNTTPNPTPIMNTTPTPNPGTGGVGEPTEQIPVVSDTTALLYEYPSATIPNPTACVVYGRPAEQLWGLHGYVWGTSMTATLNNPNYKLCLLTGSLGVNGSCPSWSEQSSSNAEGFPELTSPYGLEYRSVCVVPLVQGTEEAWQLRVTVTPES